MPQAVAAVASWAVSAVFAVTGSATAAAFVGNAILWAGTIKGIATIASIAYSLSQRRQRGIISSGSALEFSTDPNAPRSIVIGESATAGTAAHATVYDRNSWLGYAVTLCDAGPVEGLVRFIVDRDTVTIGHGSNKTGWSDHAVISGHYANWMAMEFRDGSTPSTSYGWWATPEWTDAHKLSGAAHAYWSMIFHANVFNLGAPQPLWVLKGVKCYDPRKDSTYPGGAGAHRSNNSATWEWTDNGAIQALTYALGWYQNGKKVFGMGAPIAFLDVASFVVAANVADANGWTSNGTLTGESHAQNLRDMCQTFGGEFVPMAGKLGVTCAAAQVSVLTLTDDDFAGPARFDFSTPFRSRKNQGVAIWRNPADNYQLSPAEMVIGEGWLEEDDQDPRTLELQYPCVDNPTQARQLIALAVADTREQISGNGHFKPKARQVKEGQCVTINSSPLGINGKFRVQRRALAPDGSVHIEFRSETDSKYTWAMTLAGVAPTPTVLATYDPSDVQAPTGWQAAGEVISGEVNSLAIIRVTGSAEDDTYVGSILIEYRPAAPEGQAENDWRPAGEYTASTVNVEIATITPNTSYDVAVSYRVAETEIFTDRQIIPDVRLAYTLSAPASFEVYIDGPRTRFVYPASMSVLPIDYEIRQGVSWAASRLIGRYSDLGASEVTPISEAGNPNYLLKAVTRQGDVYSEDTRAATHYQEPAAGRNVVFEQDESALDWIGAKHDLTQSGSGAGSILTLDENAGVRRPFGDYFQPIDLGQIFYARNWLEIAAGRVASSRYRVNDLHFRLSEIPGLRIFQTTEPADDALLTVQIAIDTPVADFLEGWRLNVDTNSVGGDPANLTANLTAAQCWRAGGMAMGAYSSLDWTYAGPDQYTFAFDFSPNASLTASAAVAVLSFGSPLYTPVQWTGVNASIVDNGVTVTLKATTADPGLRKTGLALNGANVTKLRARIRPLSASPTWQGNAYYTTGGHGESVLYFKAVANPGLVQNNWLTATWNMHPLTVGGTDWATNTITGLRFDFANSQQDVEVEWIEYFDTSVSDWVRILGRAKRLEIQYDASADALTLADDYTDIPAPQSLIPTMTATAGMTMGVDAALKAGTNANWDQGFYSVESYTGGAHVSFSPDQTSANLMVALNSDPATNASYTSLDYAIYVRATGAIDLWESNVSLAGFSTYQVGDVLDITYDGTHVRYFKNGELLRQIATTAGRTFYADSSFSTVGGSVSDIRFGPYAPVGKASIAAPASFPADDDPMLLAVSQSATERGLHMMTRREITPVSSVVAGAPLGDISNIRFANRVGNRLRVSDCHFRINATEAHRPISAYRELLLPAPGVYAEAELRSTAWDAATFAALAAARGPAGFSAFRPFLAGDYAYREAMYWLRLAALESVGDQLSLSEAWAFADVPDIRDTGGAAIGASATWIAFNRTFNAPPVVQAQWLSGGAVGIAGVVPGSVTTAGFAVIIYDAATALTNIAGNITWRADGY